MTLLVGVGGDNCDAVNGCGRGLFCRCQWMWVEIIMMLLGVWVGLI